MNDIKYYQVHKYLNYLILRKKISGNVGKKILKEYERELNPSIRLILKL